MRSWEKRYEQLKNGEFDDRIDELKNKIDARNATKEETNEYNKLTKSKNNLKQVENVIEYRDHIKQELEDVKKEIAYREEMKKASEETKKLEAELNKIEKEMEAISKLLKNPKLSKEEKQSLIDRNAELKSKINKNNDKYVANQAVLSGMSNRNEKMKKYDDAQLKKMTLIGSSRISKCNMVANSLINGLSWDSINLKLDNWDKKYTNNTNNKIKSILKNDKGTVPKIKNRIERKLANDVGKGGMQDILSDSKGDNLKANEKLRESKEKKNFADKHPRLAKIGKWFKKLFKKEKMLPAPDKEVEDIKSFKEYIREVAEKGMNEIDRDSAEAKKEALKKRLEEMRKANREDEAKKFGQDYADKSDYRQKDDDEGR